MELSAEQLATLLRHARTHADYFRRLNARCAAAGVPTSDPMAAKVNEAAVAVGELLELLAAEFQRVRIADARSKREAAMMKRHPPS